MPSLASPGTNHILILEVKRVNLPFEVAKFFFLPFGRGAMLASERELACPATLPQIPIPACLVCLEIVNSKHSRPPLFVTWP